MNKDNFSYDCSSHEQPVLQCISTEGNKSYLSYFVGPVTSTDGSAPEWFKLRSLLQKGGLSDEEVDALKLTYDEFVSLQPEIFIFPNI